MVTRGQSVGQRDPFSCRGISVAGIAWWCDPREICLNFLEKPCMIPAREKTPGKARALNIVSFFGGFCQTNGWVAPRQGGGKTKNVNAKKVIRPPIGVLGPSFLQVLRGLE